MKPNLKALFWKEWHENARWAALALLLLSLGLAYSVYREVGGTGYSNAGAIPIWLGVSLLLTLAAPLVGLALGLLQILPELRRDQWAFLTHRPATRTALFFGKVIPGVCLYFLATFPPLLGVAWWDAVPGHVAAPFDPRLMFGGLAAICSGLAFYFAGLLTALRPARWYGSRALPVLAALLAPAAIGALTELWQAALACLVVIGILCVAAWGSFLTSGDYSAQAKPARLALGVTLYTGSVISAAAVIGLSISVYYSLFPRSTPIATTAQYQVSTTGQLRIFTYDGSVETTKDLRGNVIARHTVVGQSWVGGDSEQYLSFSDFSPRVSLILPKSLSGFAYTNPYRYVSSLQTLLYGHADTAWYFIYRTNQIVGYSEKTRLPVIYLGPRGFFGSSAEAGQFPEPLRDADHQNNTHVLLIFSHTIYCLNTQQEALTKLWSGSASQTLAGYCFLTSPSMQNQDAPVAVAAGDQIQVNSSKGVRRFALPRPFSASAYPVVAAAVNPAQTRYYFWYAPKDSILPSIGLSPSKLVTVSAQGRILQTQFLPALTLRPLQRPLPAGFGLLLPLVLLPFVSQLDLDVTPTLPILSGLVAATLAWLVCRRCGDDAKSRLLWALGVFWLGVYGVLLLLALRAWPARIGCPSCGRQRVVDRNTCEYCGARFARPTLDGTEIFEEEPHPEAALRPTPSKRSG